MNHPFAFEPGACTASEDAATDPSVGGATGATIVDRQGDELTRGAA